jgi:hypothetical protein
MCYGDDARIIYCSRSSHVCNRVGNQASGRRTASTTSAAVGGSGGRIGISNVEQSDLRWIQISNNIWRVEALARDGLQFPGVSSMMICDCGSHAFTIGTEVDLVGNKHIRCVECADCGKQTRTQQIQAQFPGVSNKMICDCGSHAFTIGTEVDLVISTSVVSSAPTVASKQRCNYARAP